MMHVSCNTCLSIYANLKYFDFNTEPEVYMIVPSSSGTSSHRLAHRLEIVSILGTIPSIPLAADSRRRHMFYTMYNGNKRENPTGNLRYSQNLMERLTATMACLTIHAMVTSCNEVAQVLSSQNLRPFPHTPP